MKIKKYVCDGCSKELYKSSTKCIELGKDKKQKHLCGECFNILYNLKIEFVKVDKDF